MIFMPGKDNPADWSSRHPENIEDWSEQEKKKHGLDEGEEIRLNKIMTFRRLFLFLLSDRGKIKNILII